MVVVWYFSMILNWMYSSRSSKCSIVIKVTCAGWLLHHIYSIFVWISITSYNVDGIMWDVDITLCGNRNINMGMGVDWYDRFWFVRNRKMILRSVCVTI